MHIGSDDEDIQCCSNDGRILDDASGLRHPECFAIGISANDAFYASFGEKCMEFVRSLTAFNAQCRLGAREQVGIDDINAINVALVLNLNARAIQSWLSRDVLLYVTSLLPLFQVNQITAYIDASNVYASDVSEARVLRLGRGGRLRVTKFKGEDLLPLAPDECADHSRQQYCFEAGKKYTERHYWTFIT